MIATEIRKRLRDYFDILFRLLKLSKIDSDYYFFSRFCVHMAMFFSAYSDSDFHGSHEGMSIQNEDEIFHGGNCALIKISKRSLSRNANR